MHLNIIMELRTKPGWFLFLMSFFFLKIVLYKFIRCLRSFFLPTLVIIRKIGQLQKSIQRTGNFPRNALVRPSNLSYQTTQTLSGE
ncbi:hypothetical protein BW686_17075 [Pseudomonas syringae]|uniref:Uncharacterized protein n=1 Tax=Pseudomonas syringae TaxID=317 RepID=A0A244EPH3_PSESX|nr:hypothetical protein BW686_17075 [Pseudomonas syringae]